MRRILFLILITCLPIGRPAARTCRSTRPPMNCGVTCRRWRTHRLSNDRVQYIQQLGSLRSALLEFETRFGTDPRRWDAKLLRVQIESMSARVEGRRRTMPHWCKSPRTLSVRRMPRHRPGPMRDSSSRRRMWKRWRGQAGRWIPERRAAVEADIAQLRKDYPDDQRIAVIQLELAVFLEQRDPNAAESMLRTLETSQNIHVAAMAQQQLASLESTRQLGKAPLDLKFKAVDGTDVDIGEASREGGVGGFLGHVVRPVPHGNPQRRRHLQPASQGRV